MNLRRLKLRARAVFAPRRVEHDLNEELAFHIERETQKHIANGISPAEARARARARFGSVSCSLTAALGAALLATPAAEQIGATVRLFDPVAYAASLLCIVTACACAALIPALRAGRIDPVVALRQD